MKVLITGANGFLGQHLTLFIAGKGYNVTALSRGVCRIPHQHLFRYISAELTDPNLVLSVIGKEKPDVIIHTAAMSKPDECNKNKEACLLQNVAVTKYLIDAAQQAAGKIPHFIYISTDFVFGENGPHSEEDLPAPLNFYGESKQMAGQLVAHSGLAYTIVRPVFIYGPVWDGLRPSFLHWVKQNLEKKQYIKVVSDQFRTPTYVTDLCRGIETIIVQKAEGAFHLAGKDILSPYEMAVMVAETSGLDAAYIENVTSDTFTEPVVRAKRSGLKIDKAEAVLGYNPVSFRQGVELTFNFV